MNNHGGYSQFRVSNRERLKDKSASVYSHNVKKSSHWKQPSTKNTETRTSNANIKAAEAQEDPR